MERCADCGRICDDWLCPSCKQDKYDREHDYDDDDE